MATLQEAIAKLSPSQRKEVERIRSKGVSFDKPIEQIARESQPTVTTPPTVSSPREDRDERSTGTPKFQDGVMTTTASGELTDFGRSLQRRQQTLAEAQGLGEARNYAEGTYERYLAENRDLGNTALLGRDQFESFKRTGSYGGAPDGGGTVGGGTAGSGTATGINLQSQLENAQRQAAIAALQKSRGQQLSALEGEQAAVTPRFQEARRGAITQAERGKAGFSEFLAQRGLQASGAAPQEEIARNVATQQQLGGLRQSEAETLADIERRRTGVESAFAQDVAATEAGLQAQALQRVIEQQEIERERQRQDELLRLETEQAASAQERQDFLSTIDRYSQDFTAQINRVRDDGDPSNDWQIPFLESARQQKIQTQGLDPATGQPLPQGPSYDRALEKWRAGAPLTQQEMQVLGVSTATKPRTTGGVSGPTTAQQIATAKWKLDNGYPLSPQESQLLGIPQGFTPPADTSGNVDAVQSGINAAVGRIVAEKDKFGDVVAQPGLEKSIASTQIVRAYQGGQIDETGVAELMTRNGLTESDIQRAVNATQLTGGDLELPGLTR